MSRQSLSALVAPPPDLAAPAPTPPPVLVPSAPVLAAPAPVPPTAPPPALAPPAPAPLSAENQEWLAQLDLRTARSRAASEQRLRQFRHDTDRQLWAMKMRLDQQIWNMNMDLRYGHLLRAAQPAS